MRLLFILSLLVSYSVSAQQFVLRGCVDDLGTDNAILLLKGEPVGESVKVKNGEFVFEKESIAPNKYVIFFQNNKYYMPIILENGNMEVKASVHSEINGYIQGMRVKGSKTYDTFRDLDKLYDKMIKTYPKEDQYEYFKSAHMFNNNQMNDEANKLYDDFCKKHPQAEEEYIELLAKFIKDHANEYGVVHLLMQKSSKLTVDQMEEVVSVIPKELMDHSDMKKFRKHLNNKKSLSPGSIAPDFSLKDMNGKVYNLKSMRGSYVLLDFWATWCGPCCAAMPHVSSVHKKYGNKNLKVVAISADFDIERWKQAHDKYQINWISLINNGRNANGVSDIMETYFVDSIPRVVLIDPNGKVIIYTQSIIEVDKVITKLLK